MEHVDHDMHDPERDAMYRFNIDGLEIGHMGDVGNPFSEEQVEFFRGVNVLLSLAGGFPVIELEELKRIVNLTNPEIVIPMHFRTLCFKLRNMHWISEFLEAFSGGGCRFCVRMLSASQQGSVARQDQGACPGLSLKGVPPGFRFSLPSPRRNCAQSAGTRSSMNFLERAEHGEAVDFRPPRSARRIWQVIRMARVA